MFPTPSACLAAHDATVPMKTNGYLYNRYGHEGVDDNVEFDEDRDDSSEGVVDVDEI